MVQKNQVQQIVILGLSHILTAILRRMWKRNVETSTWGLLPLSYHRSEAGPNYNSRELCTFFSTHQNLRDCKAWPIWDEIVTLLICFESRDMVETSRFISLIIPSIIVTSARSSQALVLQLMLETFIRLVSQPLQNISRHSLILTHCRIFPINTHYWRQLVILNNSHFSQNWM